MFKPAIACGAIALGAFGMQDTRDRPILHLKEELMMVEYTVTDGVAVVVVEAESEDGLEVVEITNPLGTPILGLEAQPGRALALSAFSVRSRELPLESLFASYAEGIYDLRARTIDGLPAFGNATLSHDLLAAPIITYPQGGAVVPSTNLVVTWLDDPEAAGYRVGLEQGETDRMVMNLHAGTNSLEIPDGLLLPGTETHLEVGAVGFDGNCTLVEVEFMTQ